ncbi:MAG: hypothetical protein ACI4N3_04750 [Alphaproteobacteria bacterium]
MKKVNIEILKEENKYLTSSLKNIRTQINAEKKKLSESQKKYDDLHSMYDGALDSPELSARFVEKLSFFKDEKYIDFANSLAKKPVSQIDELLSDLMIYPEYIKELQIRKKRIAKVYYANLVKINKYSR